MDAQCLGRAMTAAGVATHSELAPARNLGSTLGATALGAVFNVSLSGGSGGHAVSFDDITRLLQNPAAMLDGSAARQALDSALHITFSGIFVIALLTLMVATFVPNIRQDTAVPSKPNQSRLQSGDRGGLLPPPKPASRPNRRRSP
jgi:hypothetical protein